MLKYCIYYASAPSLHRESTDSLITKNGLFTEAQLLLLSCHGNRLCSFTELESIFVIINLSQDMVHAPLA